MVPTIPDGANEAFFSFGIAPWDGQNTILAIITYIAYWGRTTYGTAFFFLDTVCGGLFVFCWLVFLRYYLENRGWQWILGIAGLTAPFLLNFYGHIEINAPVYLFNLIWLITALIYLRTHNTRWLWVLIPLLVVCIKLHAVAVLFIPVCLLTFLYHYCRNRQWFERLFTWKMIGLFLLVPIYALGAFAYFFVFEDYNDPRHLQFTAMEYDRLFLPLVSPEPPLEKYNLLSFNHIFDYFSVMLLWSPVALFLIIVSVLYYRKMLKWNAPPVIISGVSLLLFASLFFVTNPLLSMQMDWDLFCFPAPVFLLFSVVIIEQLQHSNLSRNVAAGCLALALLSIPTFVVNASKPMISNRLESLGVRIFQTYYEWTTRTINYALSLEDSNKSLYLSRKRNVIDKLEPHATPGKDYEYARLLVSAGNDALRLEKNSTAALAYFEQANFYYPNEKTTVLKLMEVNFRLKDFQKAYPYGLKLLDLRYPSEQHALRIVTHIALEAEMYAKAQKHTLDSSKRWPKDEMMAHLNQRLVSGTNLDELKSLFTTGE